MMTMTKAAQMQGELWSSRAQDWAEIQEGEHGWGIRVYERVLDETGVGAGTTILDIGCGAGRLARMAAERGASVAGLDAAEGLVQVARARVPEADFRVGDMESLPWEEDAFEVVAGLSSFQFAADPSGALREAGRVAKDGGRVVAVVPGRPEDSELTPFLMALRPLMPSPPPGVAPGGPLALSQPGALEAVIEEAGLSLLDSDEVDSPIEYPDEDTMLRGMLSAGPAALAIRTSGEEAARRAALESLAPFRNASGGYRLENRFRIAIATR